jgi:hypothetical protein
MVMNLAAAMSRALLATQSTLPQETTSEPADLATQDANEVEADGAYIPSAHRDGAVESVP